MQKRIPIGISDFSKLRESNYYFVDKSLLIKEFVEDGAEIVLLPRPRRFGKTLNLSMLYHFFSVSPVLYNSKVDRQFKEFLEKLEAKQKEEKNTSEIILEEKAKEKLLELRGRENPKNLFKKLKIEKWEKFNEYCFQYPVIYISLKEIESGKFEEAYKGIKEIISDLYNSHKYLLYFLSEEEQEYFRNIISKKGSSKECELSLRKLSNYLYSFWGQKAIILIDEYDLPIHNSYFSGYYEEMIGFMRAFLSAGLKDNTYLFKGVLTGILRVSRESIFSGLNNLGVYSLLSSKYSDKFGFTDEEIKLLLSDLGEEEYYEPIKEWYNGYQTKKGFIIYNPWSVLNFLNSEMKELQPYWINTSANLLIKEQIKKAGVDIKSKVLVLIEGKSVESTLEENIVFEELEKPNKESNIWSFFFFSGYLTFKSYEQKGNRYWYELVIPNTEIKVIFQDVVLDWFYDLDSGNHLKQLLSAIRECDIELLEGVLQEFVLQALSYHDLAPDVESAYHAFFVGLFFNLQDEYEILSNRESGLGRLDLALIPKDKGRKGLIMELKRVSKYKKETVEEAADRAFKQIEKLRYEEELKKRGVSDIVKLAVVFDGKKLWVKERR